MIRTTLIRRLFSLAYIGALGAFASAQAAVIIGSQTFDDDAFADAATVNSNAAFRISDGTAANFVETTNKNLIAGALTDQPALNPSAIGSFATCWDYVGTIGDTCGSITFSFIDNVIVNLPGADFAVFELNVPNNVRVTIGATTLTVLAASAGVTVTAPGNWPNNPTGTFSLNSAAFDLTDFGIAAGASVSSLTLDMSNTTNAVLVAVPLIGAINSRSVPEPSSLALLGLGLAGLAASRRRKR